MRRNGFHLAVLRELEKGEWLTGIELWLTLAYPASEQQERRCGYAPVYQALARLVAYGYIERRQRAGLRSWLETKDGGLAAFPSFGAPSEYGITEAGLAFMDAWKGGE